MTTGDTVDAQLGEWTFIGGLDGPGLDERVWHPGYPPPPDGSPPHGDPGAEVVVGDGEVSVTIQKLSHFHDSFQEADNVKFLMFSPRLVLPESGPATFGVDMAAEIFNGSPLDVRFGSVSLNVVDISTGNVFDICTTSSRAAAMHENLGFVVGRESAFSFLVEEPFVDLDDDLTSYRPCEITLDRGNRSAEWRIGGEMIYRTSGISIPEGVNVGFGLFTLVPLRGGASRSVQGQGLQGRWRRFRFKGATFAE